MPKRILYIGGFELPDKNAAAQRVVGIAKGFRALGHEVVFLNSLKKYEGDTPRETEYFGFKCYEYQREGTKDYLLTANTALSMIEKVKPDAIVAYNYPAVALERIRKYCKRNNLKCYADATEWYQAVGENVIYRVIKNLDTAFRMRIVQKRLDGVIAISRFLYDYYKDSVKTVLIPPTVDLDDEKWNIDAPKQEGIVSFVYAGVPIALKEKLDTIVSAIEKVSQEQKVVLNVVGVTEQQFVEMYGWTGKVPDAVKFWGRVEHKRVIELVKQSSWAIILRDNNKVVKAGFPTKLVEAISCGTPVIINEFSNVFEFLDDHNSVRITDMKQLVMYLNEAVSKKPSVSTSIFDYHRYVGELEKL